MELDVRDFLKRFSADVLVEKDVLRGTTLVLNHSSVSPLLKLMSQEGVTRIHAEERRWHLTSSGDFENPLSGEAKSGAVADLGNPGNLFNYQNVALNPHYQGGSASSPDQGTAAAEDEEASANLKFGLERDLQEVLRSNIDQLDPNLTITDGGTEKVVPAGRIDITARDEAGNIVVIELKAGTATLSAMGQILSYMGSVTDDPQQPVRGILVASEFHDRLVLAAKAVPNVSLVAYSIKFSFEQRWPLI